MSEQRVGDPGDAKMPATDHGGRRALVVVLFWGLAVLAPDVIWHGRALFDGGRMGVAIYVLQVIAAAVIAVGTAQAIARIRAHSRRLGFVALLTTAAVATFVVMATFRYRLAFKVEPRPIVIAYFLENPRYSASIVLVALGRAGILTLVLGPIVAAALMEPLTRRPLDARIPRGVFVVAALVLVLAMSPARRFQRAPHTPDARGASVLALGVATWLSNSDLPTLPVPHRVPVAVASPTESPDVLLIIGESLGREQLAPWNARAESPAIQAFLARHAQHAVWYPRASTDAPVTNVAVPSLASGLDASHSRGAFATAPLAWHFARACGYRTALISAEDYDVAFFRGFMLADDPPDVSLTAGDFPDEARVNDRGIADARVVDEAIKLLESPHTQPLFLTVQMNATHFPCWAPELDRTGEVDQDPSDFAVRARECAVAVRYVDTQMGRIFDAIERSGRIESTLIVSTSDHGESFHPQRPLRPIDYYEAVLGVPLFIHVPASVAERHPAWLVHARENADVRVANLDVVPTLLETWGQSPKDALDGRSLFSQIPTDRTLVSVADSAIYEASADGFAVYQGHVKWLYDEHGGLRLFDLDADPREDHDLGGAARPEARRALDEGLRSHPRARRMLSTRGGSSAH